MTSADWLEDQALVILPLCVVLLSVCVFVTEVTDLQQHTSQEETGTMMFRVLHSYVIHIATLHCFVPHRPP